MKVTITREAVCSQDDQIGPPLTMVLYLSDEASLATLVEAVREKRFLQFSSSHPSTIGTSGGKRVVRVHDASFASAADEYLVGATSPVRSVIENELLTFAFEERS